MRTGQPQGRVLRFPGSGPWRPPRWQAVRVGRISTDAAGMRMLERLVLRLVRRGWNLLRALDEASGIDMEVLEEGPVLSLLAVDSAWLDLLCHLARHEVDPNEVETLAADVRRLGREQTTLRQAVYALLPADRREGVASAERIQQVSEHEVRQAVIDMVVAMDGDDDDLDIDDDDYEPFGVGGRSRGLLSEVNASRRMDWEQRPLPAGGALRTCLRGLPAEWLDAISARVGGRVSGSRRDRETRLAAALLDGGTLDKLLAGIGPDEVALLQRVLAEGGLHGAAELTALTGTDDQDGWFWTEQPPRSVLGGLRWRGLVYVGARPDADAVPERCVLIPVELREPLRERLR